MAQKTRWEDHTASVLARLKRAEGQVRGVIQMVEQEQDCEKVAQQMAAVRKALDRAFYEMMACMTRRELMEAGVAERKALARIDWLGEVLARYG